MKTCEHGEYSDGECPRCILEWLKEKFENTENVAKQCERICNDASNRALELEFENKELKQTIRALSRALKMLGKKK